MFCEKCGAEINSEAKFCPKCGAVITKSAKEGVAQSSIKANEGADHSKDTSPVKKKSGKGKFIALAAIAVVAVGAVFIGMTVLKKKPDENTVMEVPSSETQMENTNEADFEITADNKTTGKDKAALVPGSNMSDAVLVPLGTKVFCDIEKQGNVWFSFTTGAEESASYYVTVVNTTTGSDNIQTYLYDEYGNKITTSNIYAKEDGTPVSFNSNELKANTTYYVRLYSFDSKKQVRCSIVIKNPNDKNTALKTVGNVSQSGGTANELSENGEVVAGTNQSSATMLPIDTKVLGTIAESGNVWFGFTTGESETATYTGVAINTTAGSDIIEGFLYDEYGNRLSESNLYAKQDGTPISITSDKLKPNTTYYIRLFSKNTNKKVSYSIAVKSSEEKKTESTLVFDTPFEINETQIQFVANKAEFTDEAKAKEVLKPVAEAIKKASGHSIMIAGTTATDGEQSSCVELSNQRAEAVKNILVNTYNVSESQVKTIGLGYEKDPFERGKDIDGNGKFVETEAVKNRRVVILDADDSIAQQLLK